MIELEFDYLCDALEVVDAFLRNNYDVTIKKEKRERGKQISDYYVLVLEPREEQLCLMENL